MGAFLSFLAASIGTAQYQRHSFILHRVFPLITMLALPLASGICWLVPRVQRNSKRAAIEQKKEEMWEDAEVAHEFPTKQTTKPRSQSLSEVLQASEPE